MRGPFDRRALPAFRSHICACAPRPARVCRLPLSRQSSARLQTFALHPRPGDAMTDAGPPWPGPNPALPHTQAPPPPHDAPPPPPLTPEQRAERKVQMILDKLDPERLGGITIGEDGVEVCGFNYRTVLDAWEAAKLMALAGSGISPWLRNNPGGCLYIITRAMQLRMDPYSIANWSYEVEQKAAPSGSRGRPATLLRSSTGARRSRNAYATRSSARATSAVAKCGRRSSARTIRGHLSARRWRSCAGPMARRCG
jgi:hypothetical protein